MPSTYVTATCFFYINNSRIIFIHISMIRFVHLLLTWKTAYRIIFVQCDNNHFVILIIGVTNDTFVSFLIGET